MSIRLKMFNDFWQYFLSGPLASTEGVFSLAFLRNQEIVSKIDRPNFELFLSESSLLFLRDQINMKPEVQYTLNVL